MKNIFEESLKKSYSYNDYRTLVTKLLENGKSTGNEQSEDLTHYSLLNETRMNRLDKTIKVVEEVSKQLKNITQKQIWLVLSEGWCGDAAQILPVINKMAEETENIELKIVLRDENDSLMNLFLTNSNKSIPKLIILDAESLKLIADWGPRPEPARKLISDYKEKHGVVDEPVKVELQKWYLQDKGISTQKEIMQIM